jgi:hypothetical protein
MHENVRTTAPPTPEQVAELTTQAAQMPLMYFNYARTAASFYDLRIFFGQVNVSPKGQPSFEEQLCVAMTVEFAKTLRDNLSTTIGLYEQKFGTLRQPPMTPPSATVVTPPATAPEANGRKKKRKA